jgi:hypothetical protein
MNKNLSSLLTELKEIIPRYMTLEMQVLAWDRHRNVAWLLKVLVHKKCSRNEAEIKENTLYSTSRKGS